MHEKETNIFYMFNYSFIVLVLFPNVDKHALIFYGIGAYAILIVALITLGYVVKICIDIWCRDENKDMSDVQKPMVSTRIMIGLVFLGAMLLFLGIMKVSQFHADFGNKPTEVVMERCRIVKKTSSSPKGGIIQDYYLEVTYYPNTKAVVRFDKDKQATYNGNTHKSNQSNQMDVQDAMDKIQKDNEKMMEEYNKNGVDGVINSVMPQVSKPQSVSEN